MKKPITQAPPEPGKRTASLLRRMKKYASFYRIEFLNGLQYRAAALGGVATQFAWGFMAVLLYAAFYQQSEPGQFPMEMQALSSYLWLQEALLVLFSTMVSMEIPDLITDGNVSYELCRPLSLYGMWFVRDVGKRLSRATLRCLPILAVAVFLPKPYGLSLPVSLPAFLLFLFSMVLASLLAAALVMLLYTCCFFMISSLGVRLFFVVIAEFFSGAIVPLPFWPEKLRRVAELLPFASLGNAPLRIYSGDLAGTSALLAVLLQIFWIAALVCLGSLLMRRAVTRAVVQGG